MQSENPLQNRPSEKRLDQSRQIRRDAELSAYWTSMTYSAIVAAIVVAAAFLALKPKRFDDALTGVAVLSGLVFGGLAFLPILRLVKKQRHASAMCNDCKEPFAICESTRRDLLAAVPRVQRSTFQSNVGSDHGMRNWIREQTWVEETYRVTVDRECICCGHHTQSIKTETISTGHNSGEYPA